MITRLATITKGLQDTKLGMPQNAPPKSTFEILLPTSYISSEVPHQTNRYLSYSEKSKAAATDLHNSSSHFKDKFINGHDHLSFVLLALVNANGTRHFCICPSFQLTAGRCFQRVTKHFLQETQLSLLEQL